MKKSTLLPLVLLATGCFQLDSAKLVGGPSFGSKAEPLEVTQACAQEALKKSAKSLDQLISIKLKNTIVDRVLAEMKGKTSTSRFWSMLSEETAKDLNLDLNLNLGPDPVKNNPEAFQAVAFFFQELAKTNNREESYQAKLSNGYIYSYQVKGEAIESISRMMKRCDEKSFDVSSVTLPVASKQAIKEVSETYKCKADGQTFDLVRTPEKSFLITKAETIEIENSKIKIKENKRKIVLSIDTKEIQLTLKFKKKRERDLEEIDGNKTKIDLRTSVNDIDGTGACEFLKKS